MDVSLYLNPHSKMFLESLESEKIASKVEFYRENQSFPDLSAGGVALIGVEENRGQKDAWICNGADGVRREFYRLYSGNFSSRIVDLGNLILGNTLEETYEWLEKVLAECIVSGMKVILIGGSQDLTYAYYKAYVRMQKKVELLCIDSKFDMGTPEQEMDSSSYMGKILVEEPNYLMNYTHLGYQRYLVNEEYVELMRSFFFDVYRYGYFRNSIEESEASIRAANGVSVDLNCLRLADSPANAYVRPTGFNAEEVCQMFKYAGMSSKVDFVGLFDYHPQLDQRSQTAMLIAEMIWCFLEGFEFRMEENPAMNKMLAYQEYRVLCDGQPEGLLFKKCLQTEHWWIQLPEAEEETEREYLPCSQRDYESALNNVIPERWSNACNRL